MTEKDTKDPEVKFRESGSGPIEFSVGDKVLLSIREDGFFVQGRLVENDRKVYENFREWLALALKNTPRRPDLPEELHDREANMRTWATRLRQSFPGEGFALFVFDFGDGGNMSYISNAKRDDMIRALEEHIERLRQGTADTAGKET